MWKSLFLCWRVVQKNIYNEIAVKCCVTAAETCCRLIIREFGRSLVHLLPPFGGELALTCVLWARKQRRHVHSNCEKLYFPSAMSSLTNTKSCWREGKGKAHITASKSTHLPCALKLITLTAPIHLHCS